MLTRHGTRFVIAVKLLLTALSAAFAVTLAATFSVASSAAPLTAAIGLHPPSPSHKASTYAFTQNPYTAAASLLHREHLAHLAKLRAEAKAAAEQAWAKAHPPQAPAPAPRVTVQAQASYAGSGMQACIIRAESGGNPQIWNATGHWGLYQFSYQTWVAHGGPPADFGHAGVAEQNQVFANTVAADGYSDWTPYDGC